MSNTEYIVPKMQTMIKNNEFMKSDIETAIIPDGALCIGNYAFQNCKNLKTVIIPESVVSIGEGAFAGCKALQSVSLPKHLYELRAQTFYECESLKKITLPEKLAVIGAGAFGKSGIEEVIQTAPLEMILMHAFEDTPLESAPESRVIGHHAFYNCNNLKTLTITQNVKLIDQRAFSMCKSLKSVIVEDGKEDLVLGQSAFSDCIQLSEVFLINRVTYIGKGCFENTGLKRVYIPDSITAINQYSFAYCQNLEKVIIPESVKEIRAYAFLHCPIKELYRPQNINIEAGNDFII